MNNVRGMRRYVVVAKLPRCGGPQIGPCTPHSITGDFKVELLCYNNSTLRSILLVRHIPFQSKYTVNMAFALDKGITIWDQTFS